MATRLQVRRGTAAAWTSANPVLGLGEPGLETDTLKVKYGDGTTAWATLGYAGSTPTPDMYSYADMEVVKNAAVNTVAFSNMIVPTLTATAASADDATGLWLQHTTPATLNAPSGAISATFAMFQRGWAPTGLFHVRLGADIVLQRNWVGFFSALPDLSATPTVSIMGFRYDTSADGTAFWRCVTSAGTTTQTVTTTTVAVAANTAYLFRVESTSTDAKFYINGTLVATHTTNLPITTQGLGWGVRVTTLVAGSKTIRWRRAAFRLPNVAT